MALDAKFYQAETEQLLHKHWPQVKKVAEALLQPPPSSILASFYPFAITFAGGVLVGSSAGHGPDGAILTGGPEVAPFDAVTFQALPAFFARG
jgi:hypothetical protein